MNDQIPKTDPPAFVVWVRPGSRGRWQRHGTAATRPEARDVPAAIRVRKLLKVARSLGFRAVFVGTQLPDPPKKPQALTGVRT